MIDIRTEETAPFTKAINRWVPGDINISTGWRWVGRGIKGHRLEIIKIGGRTYTSKEAIERFLSAINNGNAVTTSSTKQRYREINAAEARLAAAGIK